MIASPLQKRPFKKGAGAAVTKTPVFPKLGPVTWDEVFNHVFGSGPEGSHSVLDKCPGCWLLLRWLFWQSPILRKTRTTRTPQALWLDLLQKLHTDHTYLTGRSSRFRPSFYFSLAWHVLWIMQHIPLVGFSPSGTCRDEALAHDSHIHIPWSFVAPACWTIVFHLP